MFYRVNYSHIIGIYTYIYNYIVVISTFRILHPLYDTNVSLEDCADPDVIPAGYVPVDAATRRSIAMRGFP